MHVEAVTSPEPASASFAASILLDIFCGVSACATLDGAPQRQFGQRKDRVTAALKPVFRLAL